MQRLSTLRIRALAQPYSIAYRSHTIPIHLHLQAQSVAARSRLPSASNSAVKLASTTSSPKSAEGPSAQSGGSRSKDAAEAAEANKHKSSTPESAESAESSTPSSPETAGIDTLSERSALGRTGGGKPLGSSSKNAPPPPKTNNASIPGDGKDKLSKEQKREVDEHNRQFEKRHDRATPASKDKVNKEFWSGGGTRESPGTE